MINGVWLSINEYSAYRGISISTIRRYIKAKRVQYKLENRRYYIYVSKEQYERRMQKKESTVDSSVLNELKEKIISLEKQIKELKVENSELKMLVDLYEGKKANDIQPPEIPLIC